jgi:single-strand DNA-binding protein
LKNGLLTSVDSPFFLFAIEPLSLHSHGHRLACPQAAFATRVNVGGAPLAGVRRRCQMSTKKKSDNDKDAGQEGANEVRLAGTVSGEPERRVLPSGDELCVVRVVVPRLTQRVRSDGRRDPSVDVLDCCAWDSRPRRTVAGWRAGDEVEVSGALRRRFYRAGGSTESRVEVEISSARRVRRAATG